MKRLSTLAFTLFTLFLLPGVQAWAQTAKLTPELIANIKYVFNPSISPDGEWISYIKRTGGTEDEKPGTYHYDLYLVSAHGGEAKMIFGNPNDAYNVSWGPKGEEIYFTSKLKDQNEQTQVYAVNAKGGEPRLVTSHTASVGSYSLSPDGKWLAFTSTDPETDNEKTAAKSGKDWIVYGEDYKYTRLYLMNIETGQIKRSFNENLHVTGMTWAPDNQTILFRAATVPETDHIYMFQKIYKLNINENKPAVMTKTEGKLGSMSISPDGTWLAYAGAVDISDPLAQSLFIVPMTGGDAINLTEKYEGSVEDLKWKDKGTLLMLAYEGAHSTLYEVDMKKREKKVLYSKGKIIHGFDLDNKGKRMTMAGEDQKTPSALYASEMKKIEFKKIVDANPEWQNVKLAKQEVIEWTGPDGWRIQGILTYPLNYQEGQRYPLLLQIHGGPEGISANGFNTRGVYPVQWYATNGYFVLEPNYRGSKGRGVAFSKGDHKDLAGKEFEDVLAGIDYLIEQGKVDRNKVGTGGFSYGGYFSAWAATRYSDRFKAAMMGAGISNWISFCGTTDIIYENSLVHWNLWWYDHMELVWDRSPLAHINNAKTATLIVHGEKDDRVPIGQGIELYNALKLKEVPVEMVVYKRQPHGIRERAAAIDYMNRTLAWFDKYVKGEGN